jgi:hypothetical protein
MMRAISSGSTTAGLYINNVSKLESLLISVQLISIGSSCEPLLIVPSSTAILKQNRFGPDSKTISSGSGIKPLMIFLNL